MEPLVPRSSPYAYLKGLGVGGRGPVSAGAGSQLRFVPEPGAAPGSGKKPHLTLNRPIGSTLLNPASSEESMDPGSGIRSAAGEVSAGYVSEGDALAVTGSGGFSDPLAELSAADLASGYMSEGGISLYARKMQAKLREGIEQCVRDSIRRHDVMNDSFEDSSSLSSGLSENIDEISTDDLTGSSLSDHQAAYHNSVVNITSQSGLRYPHSPANSGGGGNSKFGAVSPAHQKVLYNQQQQQKKAAVAAAKKADDEKNQSSAPAPETLQQRKLSEQESIDQLLQKCRTSARGQGSGVIATTGTSAPGNRPKSAQMNGGLLAPARPAQQQRVQLSSDGQILRVTAGGNYTSSSHRGRTPLTGNTLKLLKAEQDLLVATAGEADDIIRPGSAQAGAVLGHRGPTGPQTFSGYHSLDRKRHLIGYFSETDNYSYESAHRFGAGSKNGSIGGYGTNLGTLGALVSPRRYPLPNGSLSLPVSHEGPLLPGEEDIAATWTRHNTSAGTPTSSRKKTVNGTTTLQHHPNMVMSRSLIERRELKISPEDRPENQKFGATETKRNRTPGTRGQGMMGTQVVGVRNGEIPVSSKQNGVAVTNGIPVPGPRMARSSAGTNTTTTGTNYARSLSANSERVYANLIQRATSNPEGDVLVSPTAQLYLHKISGDHSPTGQNGKYVNGGVPGGGIFVPSVYGKVAPGHLLPEEEAHGSSLSLASTSSSIYASAEEKYQAEIRKLHREVDAYRDKVKTLTAQQSTYSSMVQAFEKALQGMVKRVEALQCASQQKEDEVNDLREKINVIREMSSAAGINVDHVIRCASPGTLLQRRHTFNSEEQQNGGCLVRQPSCESMVSTVSQRSSVSNSSKGSKADRGSIGSGGAKSKKSWIRSSFSRAFSKTRKSKNESMSDVEEHPRSVLQQENGISNPCSPLQSARSYHNQSLKGANSSSSLTNQIDADNLVSCLKEKLAAKDHTLTECRLEQLTCAHEVDQLRETLSRLKNENQSLKQNNERLNRMVSEGSRNGSQTSLPLMSDGEESMSEYGGQTMSDVCQPTTSFNESSRDRDLRKLMVSVVLNLTGEMAMTSQLANGAEGRIEVSEILIGQLAIGARTSWDRLDGDLGKVFNEYLHKIDPVGNLSLNNLESVVGYRLGTTCRSRLCVAPKHLPAKCTEKSHTLQIVLRGVKQGAVDALAFETLIPKSNLQRFVHQLQDQKRLILCGSCGTGKTYLARKLAEYLVLMNGRKLGPEAIDIVQIEEGTRKKSAAEALKERLSIVMRKWREGGSEQAPTVVILDNLHHISAFSDAFSVMNCMENKNSQTSGKPGCLPPGPYIIGTMNQSVQVTNLQVQHSFRFQILANHMEPVKGFLGRYLRRRLVQEECRRGFRCPQEMVKVLEWLPKVWAHLNKFLEAANSSDVTIGPRIFLSCPLNLEESRDWFIDLWNRNIQPYLIQAAREGQQMYGKGRSSLEDPCEFICDEWPWTEGEVPDSVLARISPDDLSLSSGGDEGAKLDPLVRKGRFEQ